MEGKHATSYPTSKLNTIDMYERGRSDADPSWSKPDSRHAMHSRYIITHGREAPPSTSNLNAGLSYIRHVEFDFNTRYYAFIGGGVRAHRRSEP